MLDFYQLLPDFNFYRLNQDGLVNLGDYSPVHEIFSGQNILAISKTISLVIIQKYIHCYE
jgi:hypothetical protein